MKQKINQFIKNPRVGTFFFCALSIIFFCLFINASTSNKYSYLPFLKIGTTVDKTYGSAIESLGTQVYPVKLPTKLDFGGEEVPLIDIEVRERLDRELLVNTFWQSNTVLALKRANRWFPLIEERLKANGVPDDFKYLALIESNLSDVVSPAGAAGFWQFLKATGSSYGLLINEEVDERYNVEKATDAACRYLISAKNSLGTWTAAAASYNMGVAGFQKQQGRQAQESYYDMSLNAETNRYVFRILALKLIHQNPKDFGYNFTEDDYYAPFKYKEESLEGSVSSFGAYAQARGITYKELKMLNPWLRDNKLSNVERRSYMVKILER